MRVEHFLEDSANHYPDKTALVVGERRITYRQLDQMADRLAHALHANGVQRGDRVVIYLDNSVEAVAGIFGILKAGAIFSPVNPTTKSDKLAYILNNCRAKAILTHGRLLTQAAPAVDQAPSVIISLVVNGEDSARRGTGVSPVASIRNQLDYDSILEMAHGRDARATDHGRDAARLSSPKSRATDLPSPGIEIDLAMVIYTSGSTGFPKGVMMTHQNIDFASWSITTYLQNTPDDIILSVLPLSFDYGLYQALMSVRLGATLVLERSFAFPEMVLQALKREKATGFPVVPTIASILLQMKSLEPGAFPTLRYITNTAAALPPAHIQRLQELFPTTRIFSMYGLTECKRCTYLPPEQLKHRPASVGIAIPGTEAHVVDEHGNRVGPDVVGELVLRGPHVMKGYWENPEATDKCLRPGRYPWEKVLYSGDLFRADGEGFLYFVGRKDDIIKTRGEKVSPKEVENVLYALPGVKEAAVVGVPDDILGMAIRAVIVPADDATLTDRDVLRHCAKHLEDFMVPKTVEFRKELPKTGTGKIRRKEVQAEFLNK